MFLLLFHLTKNFRRPVAMAINKSFDIYLEEFAPQARFFLGFMHCVNDFTLDFSSFLLNFLKKIS